MAAPPEPPALAHIEKTLADAYRKEIDQEENVWRSLPFFAATLALQLAALFQVLDRLPDPGTPKGWVALGLLGCTALATLVALGFLAASIYPARFTYIAPEPELLSYAKGLIQDEEDEGADGQTSDALTTLKGTLAEQYAIATDGNRRINKRRGRFRSIAGLGTVLSVGLTLLLVATTFLDYVPARNIGRAEREQRPADLRRPAVPAANAGAPGSIGSPTTRDAGRDEGVVDPARGAGER